MQRLISVALAVTLVVGCSPGDHGPRANATASSATQVDVTWSFEGYAAGSTPENVTSETGRWEIIDDPTAPGEPGVMGQVSQNGSSRFNVMLCRDVSLRDLELSVRFHAIRGEEDQGGGPIWRAQDADNYYTCRYNPLESNFRIYKIIGGRREQLGSAEEIALGPDWHTIGVTADGDHMTCSLDGRPLLDIHDGAIEKPGQVGLWTKADAVTHFDDLSVKVH